MRYKKTAGDVTTTYFYNGNTLLGENRSDGKQLRYFYDVTGICGFSCKDGLQTTYYTYVKDVLGNIVMIKNDMGVLLARYSYDEWGNCTVENLEGTIGNINPFRYRGYYYDSESGLYYLMSRYYDPEIGQFISMDAVDYLDPDTIGGVDLYAYCRNNPIMYVDPSGHLAISIFFAVYGASLLIATVLVAGTVGGAIIGYNMAKNSSDGEVNIGTLIYGTILGATAGFAVAGAAIGLIGLVTSLVFGGSTFVWGLTLTQIAMQGFAYFDIGIAIFGALTSSEATLVEIGEFIEYIVWPTLIG